MTELKRRPLLIFMASAIITMAIAVAVFSRVLDEVSAQEGKPEIVATSTPLAPIEPATPAAAEPHPDATPDAPAAAPTAAARCFDERISLDKIRNSKALGENAPVAAAVFSELSDGSIKVEATGRVLLIQGGNEQVGILVPPGTPRELLTALHRIIDEVRYAC